MGNRFDFPFEDSFDDDSAKKKKKDMPIEDQIIMAQQEQTDILRSDVDEKILHDAISVASRDWLWSFRTTKNKLSIIKKIYANLKKMVNELF
jgi:hypothetical protein